MRKLLSLILVLGMLLTLCACESPQEKANREIKEANEAYREAQQELNDLESELEEVQRRIEQAGG